MIGVHAHCWVASKARICLAASKPFITGISMSISTRSGADAWKRSTAICPFSAITTSCPNSTSRAPNTVAMVLESSTTRIRMSPPRLFYI